MDTQDLFISHAGADKERYVRPIAESLRARNIAFWLDEIDISWGDSIPLKINEGLTSSRFLLVCLSAHYCSRPWPETELGAALSMQHSDGRKRVLPLILSDKKDVLGRYPILAQYAYREYAGNPDEIAQQFESLIRKDGNADKNLRIVIETVHTGQRLELVVPPRVSNKWVATQAQAQFRLQNEADTGAFSPFRIRWVLVDSRAQKYWEQLARWDQQETHVVAMVAGQVKTSQSADDRFEDLGIELETTFNLYAIQDGPPPVACQQLDFDL